MVRTDNQRARTAYDRAGFVDVGLPDAWPLEEPGERRMERPCSELDRQHG